MITTSWPLKGGRGPKETNIYINRIRSMGRLLGIGEMDNEGIEANTNSSSSYLP